METERLKVEPWKDSKPVVADSLYFDEDSDLH
jgi:hypothetical protein